MPTSTKLLTAKQLAAELGVSLRTVTTLRQKRAIEYLDLGHRTKVYRLDAVLRSLERRVVRPRSERNGQPRTVREDDPF
jgi:hypothetical protein